MDGHFPSIVLSLSSTLEDCCLSAEFSSEFMCSYMSLFAASSLRRKLNTNSVRRRSLSPYLHLIMEVACTYHRNDPEEAGQAGVHETSYCLQDKPSACCPFTT